MQGKCSNCRYWAETMRTSDELGDRSFCLSNRGPLAATFVPRTASCSAHERGQPVDLHLVPQRPIDKLIPLQAAE